MNARTRMKPFAVLAAVCLLLYMVMNMVYFISLYAGYGLAVEYYLNMLPQYMLAMTGDLLLVIAMFTRFPGSVMAVLGVIFELAAQTLISVRVVITFSSTGMLGAIPAGTYIIRIFFLLFWVFMLVWIILYRKRSAAPRKIWFLPFVLLGVYTLYEMIFSGWWGFTQALSNLMPLVLTAALVFYGLCVKIPQEDAAPRPAYPQYPGYPQQPAYPQQPQYPQYSQPQYSWDEKNGGKYY